MTLSVDQQPDATSVRPVLSAAGAAGVIRAAERKAAEIGAPAVITVVDDGGELQAMLRMDGTPSGAIQWSVDKAFTAAVFRTPTHVLEQALQGAPASALASFMAQPHATLAPGGCPLVVDGVIVGAVGASGGSPEEDQRVAEAGLAAMPDRP